MNRIMIAAAGLATLAVAACGSANASSTSSSSSTASGGGGRGFGRNGAAGELVQINGTRLVLNTQTGDVDVAIGSNTSVVRTRTGTVADIVAGSCVVATGQKDATGAFTASSVRVSPAVNGACPVQAPRPNGTDTATPRPTPPPGAPRFNGVRGQVDKVDGTQVTLTAPDGTHPTITVPTTVQVSTSSAASASDLAVGDCILAVGPKDSSGTVTARSVQVVPAGPNGCFSGGRGGFGGGRGGFGGGFGGGNGGATPPAD